jgi:hypothetical protein
MVECETIKFFSGLPTHPKQVRHCQKSTDPHTTSARQLPYLPFRTRFNCVDLMPDIYHGFYGS